MSENKEEWIDIPAPQAREPQQDEWTDIPATKAASSTKDLVKRWLDNPNNLTDDEKEQVWEEQQKQLSHQASEEVKSWGRPGGLVRTALREAFHRAKSMGTQGVGSEGWKKAWAGEAPTFMSIGYRKAGLPGGAVGIVGDAVTDPINSLMRGGKVIGAVADASLPYMTRVAAAAKDLISSGGEVAPTVTGKGLALLKNILAPSQAKDPTEVIESLSQNPTAQPFLKNMIGKYTVGAATGDVDKAYEARSGLQALLEKYGGANLPVSQAMDKMGRKTYGLPFKKAIASAENDYRTPTDQNIVDVMYNNDVGGFTKSNRDILNQLKRLKSNLNSGLEKLYGKKPIDFAPGVTKTINENADDLIKAGGLAEKDITPYLDTAPQAVPTKVNANFEVVPDETAILSQPNSPYMLQAKDEAAAQFANDMKDALTGTANNARRQAASRLKQMAPEWSKLIDENVERFESGNGDVAAPFFNKLVDDFIVGPRSFRKARDFSKSYGKAASGNSNFVPDIYRDQAKINLSQLNKAGVRSVSENMIEKSIADEKGLPAALDFKGIKSEYAPIARGFHEVKNVLKRDTARPAVSAGDALLSMSKTGRAWLAAKKLRDTMYNIPRAATGVGLGLKNASKSNIWDNLLREYMIQQSQNQEE